MRKYLFRFLMKKRLWIGYQKIYQHMIRAKIANRIWTFAARRIITDKLLVEQADWFNISELGLLCALLSQRRLDLWYEACSLTQKVVLLKELDILSGATKAIHPRVVRPYPNNNLLIRDYPELVKFYSPELYEPEEAVLEREFRSKW